MKTTTFNNLLDTYSDVKSRIRNGKIKVVKNYSDDELAITAIKILDYEYIKFNRDKEEVEDETEMEAYFPLTGTAMAIGSAILKGDEDRDESEKLRNDRRYKVGIWNLDRIADIGILELINPKPYSVRGKKLYRRQKVWSDTYNKRITKNKFVQEYENSAKAKKACLDKNNSAEKGLKIVDEEAFLRLLLSVDISNIEDKSPKPLSEPANDFKTQYHSSGSLLARKVSRRVRRMLENKPPQKILSAINKQIKTGHCVNVKMFDFLISLPIDVSCNLRGKNYTKEQMDSVRREAEICLKEAKRIGSERFFFMYYYDWRFRLYIDSIGLNYQSSKFAKSLILFSEGKEIGEDGEKWLKVNLANCIGKDKLPIMDRAEYVDKNIDLLKKIADNPLDYLDEIKKWDDPYSGLAGLFEYKRYLDSGEGSSFVTGLPIALDATNSGSQIYAMLAKDENLGSLCNLLPDTARGDVYLFVANNVDLFTKDPYWSKFYDMRRKICKRSVMTRAYSCGAKTMGKHIWSDFRNEPGFEAMTRAKADQLGRAIYNSCVKHLGAMSKIMDRLIKEGVDRCDEGQYLYYDLPDGAPVEQVYHKHTTKQIEVTFQGKRIQQRVVVGRNPNIWRKKVEQSSSPNIIHSFDGFYLRSVLNNAEYDMLVVHDSFACNIGDCSKMFNDVRSVAISIFSGDLLKDVLGITDVEFGTLKVSGIADNQYFIS